jgi:integrase
MPYVFQSKDQVGKPHARWRFQYTDWKRRRRTATGTTSELETRKLALAVQSHHDAIRNGWKPAPKPSDRPRPIGEVVDEYLAWGAAQGGRGGRPWGTTHQRMRKTHLAWWQEQLGCELLSDLGGELGSVERALRELEAAGKSGKTLQNYSEAIAAFCDWAVERQYLDKDPLNKLKSFDTTPNVRRRAMTPAEIRLLLEHCSPKRRLCYEAAFATGLRAGELRSLKVSNLDVVRGGLTLEAAWTKSRRAGFQPLPAWLVEGLVASAKGKSAEDPLLYVPTHTARDLEEDLKVAGIPKATDEGKADFHSCRVAYVTFVLEAGASVSEAQTLARHATAGLTLNTYARTRNERLSQVAELVGRSLRSTAGAQRPTGHLASHSRGNGSGLADAGSIPAASTEKRGPSPFF